MVGRVQYNIVMWSVNKNFKKKSKMKFLIRVLFVFKCLFSSLFLVDSLEIFLTKVTIVVAGFDCQSYAPFLRRIFSPWIGLVCYTSQKYSS